MAKHQHAHLRTTPIPPHTSIGGAQAAGRFGKPKRPLGDPVSPPKQAARYIPPPITNLTIDLSLSMEVILPDQAKAAEVAQMLVFHSVGDTGGIHGDDVQKAISDAMAHQIANPDHNKPAPAFYYNHARNNSSGEQPVGLRVRAVIGRREGILKKNLGQRRKRVCELLGQGLERRAGRPALGKSRRCSHQQ